MAVLIAILLPALSKARASAWRTQCASNMRSIMHAFTMYSMDYDGYFPPCDMQDYSTLNPAVVRSFAWPAYRFAGQYIGNDARDVEGHVSNLTMFCPGVERRRPSNPQYGEYTYDMGIGYNGRWDSLIAWRFRPVSLPAVPPGTRDASVIPLKVMRFKDAASVIVLADVLPDYQFSNGASAYKWAKMYYDDLGGFAGTGPGMAFSYRHLQTCNVAFADGHVESFRSEEEDSTNFEGQKNRGLHKAILDKIVTYKATGRD